MAEENEEIPLVLLNGEMARQVHPQTFGTPEERAASLAAEENKEVEEMEKVRDARRAQNAQLQGMLDRHFVQVTGGAPAPTAEPEGPSAEELAAPTAEPEGPSAEELAAIELAKTLTAPAPTAAPAVKPAAKGR